MRVFLINKVAAMNTITIALTKGRILKETLPLLAAADIVPLEDMAASRKLIFDTNQADVKLLLQRGVDVPTYVRYGSADMGVSGKDMLLEDGSQGLYEVLDLEIAKCRLMTAAPKGSDHSGARVRVASKFINVAKRFYAEKGVQAELIKLYGGMELAPLMGLADEIVDIVDTGNTLRANGLEERELIAEISSRLIVNQASMKLKHRRIKEIVDAMSAAIAAKP